MRVRRSHNIDWLESQQQKKGKRSRRAGCTIEVVDKIFRFTLLSIRANGHIFNVGNHNNVVTVRHLPEMMTKVSTKVIGESPVNIPKVDVRSKKLYGEGHDDGEKRILDMPIINRQLEFELDQPEAPIREQLASLLRRMVER